MPGSPFAFGTQPTLIGCRATVIAESQPSHHHDAGGVREVFSNLSEIATKNPARHNRNQKRGKTTANRHQWILLRSASASAMARPKNNRGRAVARRAKVVCELRRDRLRIDSSIRVYLRLFAVRNPHIKDNCTGANGGNRGFSIISVCSCSMRLVADTPARGRQTNQNRSSQCGAEKITANRHQWILLRSASYGGTGYELIPLFASICVHSRLENPRKKTRIATSVAQRSQRKNSGSTDTDGADTCQPLGHDSIHGVGDLSAAINRKVGRRHSSFQSGCSFSISGGGSGSKSFEMRKPESINVLT